MTIIYLFIYLFSVKAVGADYECSIYGDIQMPTVYGCESPSVAGATLNIWDCSRLPMKLP